MCTFRRASDQQECIAIEPAYRRSTSTFSSRCDNTRWCSYLSSTLCSPSWRAPTSDLSLPSKFLCCIRSHIVLDCYRWWSLLNQSCTAQCRIDWTRSMRKRHYLAARFDLWWDGPRRHRWPTHCIWRLTFESAAADSVRSFATRLWRHSNYEWRSWARPNCPLVPTYLVCATQFRVKHCCCCWRLCGFQLWPNFESRTIGLCSRTANRNFSWTANVVYLYYWHQWNDETVTILVRRIPIQISFHIRPSGRFSLTTHPACQRRTNLVRFFRGYSKGNTTKLSLHAILQTSSGENRETKLWQTTSKRTTASHNSLHLQICHLQIRICTTSKEIERIKSKNQKAIPNSNFYALTTCDAVAIEYFVVVYCPPVNHCSS